MIEMILASMAGMWLGLFLLVSFGTLIWISESESFLIGLSAIAIMWAIIEFGFGIPIFALVTSNILLLFVYVGLFIAVGSLWAAMWKLPKFLQKNSDRINSDYISWADLITRSHESSWKRTVRDKIAGEEETTEPKPDTSYDTFLESSHYRHSVKNNKDRVASWVLLWPASVAWELSHKPFIWVWDRVYYGIGHVLEGINKNAARKILQDRNK